MTKSKKLVCKVATCNFEEAVELISVDIPTPKDNQVLIKTSYVGVNATDINVTSARYFPNPTLPFDIGLEGLGEIVEVGSAVCGFVPGQAVAYISFNAYAEHVCVNADQLLPVPSTKAEYVSLLVSGLTASIALDMVGEIKEGDKVLITAAAGGLGQFCVQWAKNAGCHVIGTCSSEEKANFIKGLGCDEVINYLEEDLDKVLTEKYPEGLDVIWETIGGKTFETLTRHLGVKGRLVLIGAIEGYQTVGIRPVDISMFPSQILLKSSSLRGFLLTHYSSDFASYFSRLVDLVDNGQLKVLLDDGQGSEGGTFNGLQDVTRAVQHLYTGKTSGKVIVKIGS